MPINKQNNIPNSNNLFAIFQAQVESSTQLVNVIVKSGMDKNLVKTIELAATAMNNALDIIFRSLKEMESMDTSNAKNTIQLINTLTTQSLGALVKVVTDIAKMDKSSIRAANRSIKHIGWLMFGKPGRHPAGIIPLLEKIGEGKNIKSITDGIKVLEQLPDAVKDLNKMAVILGVSLPMVALSIITVKALNTVIGGLLQMYSIASHKEKQIINASKAFEQMASSLLVLVGDLVLVGLTFAIATPLILVAMTVIYALTRMVVIISGISKQIEEGQKSLKQIALALLMLSTTALLMAVTGQFITANWENMLTVTTYLLVLVGACMLLAFADKFINDGTKQLIHLAFAITILAGTTVLMAAAGRFITANWENMLIVTTYLLVLVGACMLLAFASKWIEKGTKELLHIALAITILAGTAMLMAVVGQFITTNWENMLIMSAYLLVLVGACMLLAFASKWIEKGTKELLWIALTVAILAGVATLMIYIGSLLTVNWEPVLAVTLLLTVLVGAVWVVAKQSKTIEKGWLAMLTVVLFTTTMAAVVYILAKITNTTEPLKLLEVVGIMSLIMATVGAMTIAAGALLAGPQAIIFGLGVVAMGTLSTVTLLLADVMENTTKAADAIRSAGLTNPDDIISIISLPIKTFIKKDKDGRSLFGYIKDLPNPMAMSRYVAKVKAVSSIAASIGLLADVLQHIASLNMPDPDKGYDENGRPKGYKQMKSDDFIVAAQNAGSILMFFTSLFDDKATEVVFGGSKVTADPLNMQAIEKISRGTRRKIKYLGDIVAAVGGMAVNIQNISSLLIPDVSKGFTEDGRPKGYREMSGDDFRNAAVNAGSMLAFFTNIFAEKDTTMEFAGKQVTVKSISMATLDNISRGTKRKIARIGKIVAVVGGMGETLKNLAGMIVPDAVNPGDFNENGTPKKWRKMTEADFNNAMKMAEKMLLSVINVLGDEKMQDTLSNISRRNMKKLGVAMESINGLGVIMDLVKALAGGRIASKWKMDNNTNSPTYGQEIPVEYINITEYIDKNDQKIKSTIYDLIMCPISAFELVSGNKSTMKTVKKAGKIGKNIASALDVIKQPISDIIDLYNSKLSGVDVNAIKPAFEGVIFGIVSPLADFDTNRMETVKKGSLTVFERVIASMTDGSKITDNAATNFQNNMKETAGLIRTVDSVNLDKLKAAGDLMKHISELSKSIRGDFKDLAKAINEDLLEALENLTGALGDVSNKDFNVVSAGSVISKQSGSAGVAERREPPQPTGTHLTKADLDRITKAINDISIKIGKVITPDSKVQVKM